MDFVFGMCPHHEKTKDYAAITLYHGILQNVCDGFDKLRAWKKAVWLSIYGLIVIVRASLTKLTRCLVAAL